MPRSPLVRLSALAALACPVAMAVVAVAALAGDVAIAVLAVVLLLGASAAIWVTLTNRGGTRIAGAAASALAVAGLVVVLATHWHGVVVLVALLALLALFGLTARYALGRTRTPVGVPESGSSSVAPGAGGGAGVLIINPKSGGGKADAIPAGGRVPRHGASSRCAAARRRPVQLAENADRPRRRVIGMAGGDGSQALVATVAAAHGTARTWWCPPGRGTTSLSTSAWIATTSSARSTRYADGARAAHRPGGVNGRVFVNNASLGIYAAVVQSPAVPGRQAADRGRHAARTARARRDAAGPRVHRARRHAQETAHLILVSNNRYQLDQIGGRGTRERLDDGTLGSFAAR